jgi:hypothetical protein
MSVRKSTGSRRTTEPRLIFLAPVRIQWASLGCQMRTFPGTVSAIMRLPFTTENSAGGLKRDLSGLAKVVLVLQRLDLSLNQSHRFLLDEQMRLIQYSDNERRLVWILRRLLIDMPDVLAQGCIPSDENALGSLHGRVGVRRRCTRAKPDGHTKRAPRRSRRVSRSARTSRPPHTHRAHRAPRTPSQINSQNLNSQINCSPARPKRLAGE